MTIAEKVYEAVKGLPESQAAEVLDYAECLKAKQLELSAACPTDVARQHRAELQAWVASQPKQSESAGEFVHRLRHEARY
ncbi:DUF2281 domain-containing protein [Halochromatium glycolicum]|jgi:hypothetical protein|uniref:DUF2281 domain-containing protein n=1 Tax=Halochromatium glycolicum TaxID=85075 RepID=A0AAJ0X981_9GAMM|nr:DUF2281 domain-containing protein [Halochromatium glycolicum]MBK1704584.1 hypothetical protein [Halochromatium glycolicum]